MQWIPLWHHDGNTLSRHPKRVTRAGATRSLEAHPIRPDGHRDGQAVTEIKHWNPIPPPKLLTSLLRGSTIRTRVPFADRTRRVLHMHLQLCLRHHPLLRISRIGGSNEGSNHKVGHRYHHLQEPRQINVAKVSVYHQMRHLSIEQRPRGRLFKLLMSADLRPAVLLQIQ